MQSLNNSVPQSSAPESPLRSQTASASNRSPRKTEAVAPKRAAVESNSVDSVLTIPDLLGVLGKNLVGNESSYVSRADVENFAKTCKGIYGALKPLLSVQIANHQAAVVQRNLKLVARTAAHQAKVDSTEGWEGPVRPTIHATRRGGAAPRGLL